MVPAWFEILAWFWIAICFASTLFILIETLRKPQKMWIMDVVWPISGLYTGPFAVYLYQKSLPVSMKQPISEEIKKTMERHKKDPPTWIQNGIAVFHCGAGCSIGDTIAELMVPALALTFASEFDFQRVRFSVCLCDRRWISILHHRADARVIVRQRPDCGCARRHHLDWALRNRHVWVNVDQLLRDFPFATP